MTRTNPRMRSAPRVLIADDSQGLRETYGIVLRERGFAVEEANSVASAIAALRGHGIDAALVDLKLGEESGFDVLRWVRDCGASVPVAVMTAFSQEFPADEAIALGADAYACRPLDLVEVVALVETLLRRPSPMDPPGVLHARVVAGDPCALECLDALVLRALPRRLERLYPRVPWDFALDATVDATLEYATSPHRFDPKRGSSVLDFILLIARNNLIDRLRSEQARKKRERRYFLSFTAINDSHNAPRHDRSDAWAVLISVTAPTEYTALKRWLAGDSTTRIAAALGFDSAPTDVQCREVKRFKDRLLKRLSRRFGGS